MIRRPPRSTRVRSSAASDVYKRQQPPHTFSDPDKILNKAYPDLYFPQSTARARVATANRPGCCANNVCTYCPIDAKFTILNEMGHVYQDPRVTLITEANVQSIEYQGDVATGVNYIKDGVSQRTDCDLIGLCLLYTSDAADDLTRVDLGGGR